MQLSGHVLAKSHGAAASSERAEVRARPLTQTSSFRQVPFLLINHKPGETEPRWPVQPNRGASMRTCRGGRGMRTVRPLIAGAAATAAALSMVGFAATAQAQPTVQRIHDPTVPLGVETAVNLPACPTGNTVTSVTPAPPGSVNTAINANKAKLAGDWLATGSTTFTVHCSGGTHPAVKITVSAAPALKDATGVGSDTIQNLLDQFSADYNVGKALTATHLYSWDATNPNTGAIGDSIQVKGGGCSAIARPNGSSAGITALTSSQVVSGTNCISFARSS